MNIRKLVFLLIVYFCFGSVLAQEDCGNITISLEQYRASGEGTNFGIIKVTVVDSQIDEGVITFQWTGSSGGSSSSGEVTIASNEKEGGNNIYYISSLPAGQYSVTARKYCLLEWGGTPVASESTQTIEITETSGDPEPVVPEPTVTVSEFRPALASCIAGGIARFNIRNGTAPYTITVKNAPDGSNLTGKSYVFNNTGTNVNYDIGSLQAGEYVFSVSDKFNNDIQPDISVNITIASALSSRLYGAVYSGGASKPVLPYLNHEDGPYNIFYISKSPAGLLVYTGGTKTTYTNDQDSIAKYFMLEWYFVDEGSSKSYPVEYKKIKETDSQKYFCLTLPDGMDFKDMLERRDAGSGIQLKQVGYNPDVLIPGRESDAECWNPNYINLVNPAATGVRTYYPLRLSPSEDYTFETYFDYDECANILRFPVKISTEDLIILPVDYGFYKKTGDVVAQIPVQTGRYEYNQAERYNKHILESGTYVIKYKDKLGSEWEEEIEYDKYGAVPDINYITSGDFMMPQRYSGGAATDYPDVLFYNDIGQGIRKVYTFDNNIRGNTTLTMRYEEVPPGFQFPQGHEMIIPPGQANATANDGKLNTVSYNQYSSHNQLVPGRYKISFTPDACGKPYVDEFIVNAAGIEKFDYEIFADCDGIKIRILDLLIRMPTPNADGSVQYYAAPRFAWVVHRNNTTGANPYQSSKFTAYSSTNNVSAAIPMEIFTDTENTYRFSMYFKATSLGTSLIDDVDCNFAREIEIDVSGFDLNTYYPLKFDYSKSGGYMCNNDANITVMALEGKPPYKYSLYETASDMDLPEETAVPIQSLQGNADEVVTFTINHPDATSRYYWVKVEDSNEQCDTGAKYQSITVYNLLTGNLAIQKTEELCDGDELTLTAAFMPGAAYTWYLGGTEAGGVVVGGTELTEYSGLEKNTFTVSNISGEHTGTYHVHIIENSSSSCGINTIHTAEVKFIPQVMVWDPQGDSSDWDDENNWYPKNEGLPKECTDVYIPGNVIAFPELTEGGSNTCRDIYFMPGAQLGQPQLLNYRYTYVQLDYGSGVLGSAQDKTVTKEILVTTGRDAISSEQRIRFGAATSGKTITRDFWNMLSMPVGEVMTGDFAFGGFPFSYIKKFDAENGKESFISGKWADYSNETTMKFAPGQGFGHFYYDYSPMPYFSMDHSSQWDLVKAEHNLTAPRPESILGSGIDFGLAQTNGILHFPYFADENLSMAHRMHSYTGIETSGTSVFHFYSQERKTEEFLQWTGDNITAYRSFAAYRFIPEQVTYAKNNLDFTYNAGTFENGEIVLIGNPYMSAFDFDAFVAANPGKIKSAYQMFDGTVGYDISSDGNGPNPMVAPFQSILVETAVSGNLELVFNAKDMAKTDTGVKLKSTKFLQTNKLTIKAANPAGEVSTIIRQSEDADDNFCNMDLSKIIAMPVMNQRPEIYTLALTDNGEKRAVAVNTIQGYDMLIPIGIITAYSGSMQLELNGMDTYSAKITFIDVEANQPETDITGKSEFCYPFTYTAKLNADKSAIAVEDRFMIRISPKTTTGINDPDNDDLTAYVNNKDLIVTAGKSDNKINTIILYDVHGRMIYSENNINHNFFKAEGVLESSGVYIVKVHTEKGVKEIKIIR